MTPGSSPVLHSMWTTVLLIVPALIWTCDGAKILCAVPFPAVSHQKPLRVISRELARRGHDVTFITTNPTKERIANYTEVDISASYRYLRGSTDWMLMPSWTSSYVIPWLQVLGQGICEAGLSTPDMQAFLRSPPKFDLVILERLLTPCFYGLVHAAGSPPVVGITSIQASSHSHWAHGNPSNPAYIPDWIVHSSNHMDFWQRMYSAYIWLRNHHYWVSVVLPDQEEIRRRYFGPSGPSVYEVEKNFSLMLINNHFSISYPRPNLPNMVELTGLHVEPKPDPLPKDLQAWLDDAPEGVVYFSMGTTLLGITMPNCTRRAFLDAFAQIRQKVLWKFEADMSDLPPNVKVSKWLPQQAVLAHPNVQLFIMQGGLQSLNEAAYHGVPLIGIPMLGDQHHNVKKIASAGIGIELKFADVSKDTILKAIQEVIGNERYRETMKKFSAVYHDHQAESLPKAIWWIEYVLRHNGAPHLRSSALELSWYQLLLLDVAAFIFAVFTLTCGALYYLAKFLISLHLRSEKLKCQ